jgi:hydroxyacylglutathione hydrolase
MLKIWYPVPTGSVSETVYALKDGDVNAFIYTDGEHAIAIDAGNPGDALRRELEQLPIRPDAVTHLFLTHTDRDHAGGLDHFPTVHVYLSQDEEQMIDGTTTRLLWFYRNARIDRPYTSLADGDVVRVGDITVQAIATPGHTPGSMSYLVDRRVLFTGDTLALRGGRVQPFIRLLNMDTATQRESIRKLARLENVSLLCSAHTGCAADYARAMERWHQRG